MKIPEILAAVPPREREDAVWLLTALLGMSRSELFLGSGGELSAEQAAAWRRGWGRRQAGEPLQYIAGSAPFWGRDFRVRRGVLIPRPETERLVELGLELVRGRAGARVLDIGTGSGVIAVTMKLERPDLEVHASDISQAALGQAKANAAALGAAVEFSRASLFSRRLRLQQWDLVISNPPYLDFCKDFLSREVRDWEPRLALEPGDHLQVKQERERAAWCASRVLGSCERSRPRFTALELSPRIAQLLERRWRRRDSVERVWREADLAGRKRFLLVAWRHG